MRIELKSPIINDSYTQYVYEVFDIQNREETSVKVPMNLEEIDKFEWKIGCIVGGSGSGKTTILKGLGEIKESVFSDDKCLISNFDWLTPKEASFLLSSMGLASVPTWLRPFRLLSNGEQCRAKIAYAVAKAKEGEMILIDEFTSVVDRDVAKAMSFALQKFIRRSTKRVVLASCHYDILEWVMPDWVYSPTKGDAVEKPDFFRKGRPKIHLQVSRVEPEAWNIFKTHHYMTESVNPSCMFFLFEWNNKPVGMVAVINQPKPTNPLAYAGSRTVVLPDYQGMGIGSKIAEFCGSLIRGIGGRYYTKTINPALGVYRNNSALWRGTTFNGSTRAVKDKRAKNRKTRASYCHEYVGPSITGYGEILGKVADQRGKRQASLFV